MNTGKWLYKIHTFVEGGDMHVEETALCNKCNKELEWREFAYNFDHPPERNELLKRCESIKPHLTNYCPHCGAKMK